jgi:hypothetical protein
MVAAATETAAEMVAATVERDEFFCKGARITLAWV